MGYHVFKIDLPGCDVSDGELVRDAANRCITDLGTPDVVVCNAGVDVPPGSISTFWHDPERILKVNLIGAANTVSAFLPSMEETGRGNFTFIGSMLGFIAADFRNCTPPFDKAWAYGASKAGLWDLCFNCAVRYVKKGIVFNMLALSGVEGKQYDDFKQRYESKIPIGRMLRKEDFVNEFKTCVTAKVPYDMPLFVGGGVSLW
jgi:NAD(P)-dependent dehydrogenase (short-subunit alcohol dehydrogenase family)